MAQEQEDGVLKKGRDMPVITVDPEDLKTLIGRRLSDEEMKRILPLNKMNIEDWGEEVKIEVTPDRPDLFSAEGMARQISAWLGISPGFAKPIISPPKIEVRASKVSLRPFITCGLVRGIRMSDRMIKSIMQLQEMLDLTLGRDRKKVAIGLHDVSKVKPPFFYKEVFPDEVSFVPLNSSKRMNLKQITTQHPKGVEYAHLVSGAPKWPIIIDSQNHVLSFPPIINGELTKVTELTTDMFIDITGSDEKSINYSLNILLAALEKRGGRIEGVRIGTSIKPDLSPRLIKVRPDDARKMLGLEISNKDMQALLERAGYDAALKKNEFDVLAPAYRADMLHPVDIMEDIAIAYGFNGITPEMPKLPSTGGPDTLEEFSNTLRELMIGLGFQEVLNFVLSSKEKQFSKMGLKDQDSVEISNPASQEYSICRKWLVPGLLDDCKSNKHRRFPQRIFEIADCVVPDSGSDSRASNARKISCLTTHPQASLSEILSILNAVKENFGIKMEIRPAKHNSFISGRCGTIHLAGKEEAGVFGEISPKALHNFELNNPAAALELDVQKIAKSLGIIA
jgi:phenylalanyl-tRNA synthetase beta chain